MAGVEGRAGSDGGWNAREGAAQRGGDESRWPEPPPPGDFECRDRWSGLSCELPLGLVRFRGASPFVGLVLPLLVVLLLFGVATIGDSIGGDRGDRDPAGLGIP